MDMVNALLVPGNRALILEVTTREQQDDYQISVAEGVDQQTTIDALPGATVCNVWGMLGVPPPYTFAGSDKFVASARNKKATDGLWMPEVVSLEKDKTYKKKGISFFKRSSAAGAGADDVVACSFIPTLPFLGASKIRSPSDATSVEEGVRFLKSALSKSGIEEVDLPEDEELVGKLQAVLLLLQDEQQQRADGLLGGPRIQHKGQMARRAVAQEIEMERQQRELARVADEAKKKVQVAPSMQSMEKVCGMVDRVNQGVGILYEDHMTQVVRCSGRSTDITLQRVLAMEDMGLTALQRIKLSGLIGLAAFHEKTRCDTAGYFAAAQMHLVIQRKQFERAKRAREEE